MMFWRFWLCCLVQAFCHGQGMLTSNATLNFDLAQERLVVARNERNAESGATLDPSTLRFLDSFNDPVDFAYYGGYIVIQCDVKSAGDRAECTTKSLNLISPSNKQLSPVKCGQDPVVMKLKIDENTEFGEYRCQFDGKVSTESFQFAYRFCAMNESVCTTGNSTCPEDGHRYACLVTSKKITRCADLSDPVVFDPNWCPPSKKDEFVYCPGNYSSLCEYETQRSKNTRVPPPSMRTEAGLGCPELDMTPRAERSGRSWLRYDSVLMLTPDGFDTEILCHDCKRCSVCEGKWGEGTCRCPDCTTYRAACRIKAQDRMELDTIKHDTCRYPGSDGPVVHYVSEKKNATFLSDGLVTLKVICTFREVGAKTGGMEESTMKYIGELSHYLVSFGSAPVPKVTQTQRQRPKEDKHEDETIEDKKVNYTKSLHCEHQGKLDPQLESKCVWGALRHRPFCSVIRRSRKPGSRPTRHPIPWPRTPPRRPKPPTQQPVMDSSDQELSEDYDCGAEMENGEAPPAARVRSRRFRYFVEQTDQTLFVPNATGTYACRCVVSYKTCVGNLEMMYESKDYNVIPLPPGYRPSSAGKCVALIILEAMLLVLII